MRDIKFRAWDKKYNQMVLWGDISRTNIIGSLINNNNENISHGILMQYTGLKDKNGVEIYECDIVEYDLGIDNEKPEKYKIIFDSKQCAYFLFPLEDRARVRHFTYSAKNDCNVIGNIYENPELLELK